MMSKFEIVFTEFIYRAQADDFTWPQVPQF